MSLDDAIVISLHVCIPYLPLHSCSPYHFCKYVYWFLRWTIKFDLNDEPYGREEEAYLTRKKLGLSEEQWEVCPC